MPELLNLSSTDPRLYQYINTFQERALSYGRWWGTTQLATFCITNGCIVLPREVAVIEALTLNGVPLQPRNQWYAFVTAHAPTLCGSANCSPGLYSGCGCGCGCGPFVSEDRLQVTSFATTTAGQKIRFYFNAADIGKKVIVQGRNDSGVWVRSSFGGSVQDGEQVTFAQTGGQNYTDTTTEWAVGNPAAIIKEVTSYAVLMYAVDEDGTVAQQLARYQPDETHPSYRRFYLPNFSTTCGEDGESTVKAIVSLNHVPVRTANDWLLFQNIAAYEDGTMAVRYWREGNRPQGDAYFFGLNGPSRSRRGDVATVKMSGALPTLQAELRKMTGDQTTVQVRRSGVYLAGFV